MYHDSRPVIIDLSCKDGDPSSACQHKIQFLTGISWEFVDEYEVNSNEQIVLRNDRGSMTLVSRELDGRRGFIDYGAQPIAACKFKMRLRSGSGGSRRCHVVAWFTGGRENWSSMDI